MKQLIKILIAILLIGCCFEMPYGYFQLVRFVSMTGFAIMAYQSYTSGNINKMIIYIAMVLLFQPFVKIAIGREVWNIVDVILAVFLLISIFYKKKN